jgi:hypothetical protein
LYIISLSLTLDTFNSLLRNQRSRLFLVLACTFFDSLFNELFSKKALKKPAFSADGLPRVSNGIAKVNTIFESANFFYNFFEKISKKIGDGKGPAPNLKCNALIFTSFRPEALQEPPERAREYRRCRTR